MLATCTDGLRGVRDRALLLLTWSGGGRRRSEVVGLQVTDVRRLDADTWVVALGATKTTTDGRRREKPLRGEAAHALAAWLAAAPATTGPLFRRLCRGGTVGATALTANHVARMVQRRAALSGLEGDWAAHSLRSGFVTEAGRQGVPLGEVRACPRFCVNGPQAGNCPLTRRHHEPTQARGTRRAAQQPVGQLQEA